MIVKVLQAIKLEILIYSFEVILVVVRGSCSRTWVVTVCLRVPNKWSWTVTGMKAEVTVHSLQLCYVGNLILASNVLTSQDKNANLH